MTAAAANDRFAWVGTPDGRGGLVAADAPALPVTDRGLLHGLGVFETLRAAAPGAPLPAPLWERHLARLGAAARHFGLLAPDGEALARAALELLAANRAFDRVLRVTLSGAAQFGTRAVLTTRSPGPPGPLLLLPLPGDRAAGDALAAWKTTSRAAWALLQRAARAQGADEPLLVDRHGAVLETATANVVVLTAGGLATPPADGRILPGIARAVLLAAARAAGVPFAERPVALDELRSAAALWVTNAVHGPRPARLAGAAAEPTDSEAGARLARWWRDSLSSAGSPGR